MQRSLKWWVGRESGRTGLTEVQCERPTRMTLHLIITSLLLSTLIPGASLRALAQEPDHPSLCDSPRHHELDFWIGEWNLTRIEADGTQETGEHNVVEKSFSGCGIRESYTAPGGFSGGSVSAYDKGHDEWRQFYADSSGAAADFHGGWKDDHIELMAHLIGKQGKPFTMRLTMTPRPDGSIRFFYETSADETNWKRNTELIYRRAK